MKNNDELLDEAKQSASKLFEYTFASREQKREALEDLLGYVEDMLSTLPD